MENNLNEVKDIKSEKNIKNKIYKIASYVAVFAIGATVGLSGAGNADPKPSDNSIEIKTDENLNATKDIVDIKDDKIEEKKQEPCPVKVSYITATENSIGASEANVTYVNNGKDAVKNLEFYICAWDTNGYPVKLNFGRSSYTKCQVNQPNTLPGKSDKFTWTTYAGGTGKVGKYKAVISKVEFYDGTEWINESAEQEIEDISSTTNK